MLLSDDGQVSLESASPPAEQVARYPNHGNFFSEEMLKTQIQLLKARSLPQVLASVASQKYTGIGAGSGLYRHNLAGEPRLLPASLTDVRTVRLFKKMRDSDQFWIEQEDYQKTTDPRAFCTAMDHVVPYTCQSLLASVPSHIGGHGVLKLLSNMQSMYHSSMCLMCTVSTLGVNPAA